MESIGVRHIIFTDIDKDGMLAGPNFDQLAALRASVSCEIIASGGVSTLEDITGLKSSASTVLSQARRFIRGRSI